MLNPIWTRRGGGHFTSNTGNWRLIVYITHSFSHQFVDSSKRTNYADAKKWCENASKNGFKAGRIFEPKTQSFNDKVYAESRRLSKNLIDYWIGIRRKKSGQFIYGNSKNYLEFQNWGRNQPINNARKDCVISENGKWFNISCNRKHNFICEFF